MKQKIYKIFLTIVKNFVIFFAGMVLSVLAVLLFLEKSPLLLFNNKDIGLAVIALIPVLLIYFGIAGLAGGVLGVIIYNVVRFFRKKNLL